ncbi:nucleolar MIF4G domain-containing protein 1-like isoform X2 [Xenia sp. Carnegie-2017]|uniref:nucleolar MIF4G domain-containing protein 1-like isoform X2 n=1 Tax=Xenia sp. Carnegie-2017 TaxID=2897299 RepID=UPI001F04EBD2|nr:nucleolar MIF4G domain-containing protein 1-like isoform X2 [Xenia sp. Carnegie-2017]
MEDNLKKTEKKGGLKRTLSRKQERRRLRIEKKSRKHVYFSNSQKAENKIAEQVEKKTQENGLQKKKRKRKNRNKTKIEDDNFYTAKQPKTSIYVNNDEEEIEELEKKLSLNKKSKTPNSFFDDGLGDIIDMCNAIEHGSLKTQMDSFCDDLEENDVEFERHNEIDSCKELNESEDFSFCGDEANEEFGDESEPPSSNEKNEAEKSQTNFEEENGTTRTSNVDIYGGATSKYVPPHQRLHLESKQTNERLKKQIKGLLNRLSESNISTVSGQIEHLYMTNSRNELNEILSDLLMESCIVKTAMPDGLLREHVMLIAVLNCRVGSEIGAYLLQKLVMQFDKFHSNVTSSRESKEINNVVTLLAFFYCFKIVDCVLIYDIFRSLVDKFEETDIELLLLLIRHVGVELRRENPQSLKEIILQIQAKSAVSCKMTNNSRTRFMLETMNALRNNNIRKIPNYDPAPVERERKILKSITGSNENARLSIPLEDLLSAEKKGRWWIVGSAWNERERKNSLKDGKIKSCHNNMIEISRQQRMNTDIRRNIFCTIMSSEDYIDAFEKLMRLKLKDKQTREIVRVLMDCCLQEQPYNPFYSYLIQKFCELNRSFQITVQYSLWDRFKMAADLSNENLSNMSCLLVHLFGKKSLSLSVLKVVDFTTLDKRMVQFFTELLTRLLLDYPPSTTRDVFSRITSISNLDTLKESLKLFMKHFMKPKKLTSEIKHKTRKEDRTFKLEERINIAFDALTGIDIS